MPGWRWLVVACALVAIVAAGGIAAAWLVRDRDGDAGAGPCLRDTLALGAANAPGDVAAARAIDLGFRYQYLAGGVQSSWRQWSADGQFAAAYVAESMAAGICPVLTYYMLQQSAQGEGTEPERAIRALADPDLVAAYLEDLRALFVQLGAQGETAIVHVEPDLWGFLQQDRPDGSTPVALDGALPEVAGLPGTAAGLARAVVRLRDQYAPGVLLAFHLSHWGNGRDFVYDADPALPARAAADGAAFYAALGAPFDLLFTEFSDRDAGFKEHVSGDGGASWWDDGTFDRHLAYLDALRAAIGLPIVLWQVPYGNTVMRAMDNTWNHFQDNKVERLLGPQGLPLLRRYRDAGVVALLFGRGADGATDASDANGDGLTNPEPIAGNTRPSRSADDDGGYFRERAAAYADRGPLRIRSD